MLKAKLPTQQELIDLYKEVETLRKEKKLRDDTVRFLQKEKEVLQKEVWKCTLSMLAVVIITRWC